MPTLRNNAPGPRGLPGMVGGIEPGEQLTITDEQFQAAMERPAFAGLMESGELVLAGEGEQLPEPAPTPEPPAPPEELPPVPGDGAPGAPPAPLSLKRK